MKRALLWVFRGREAFAYTLYTITSMGSPCLQAIIYDYVLGWCTMSKGQM